MITAEQRDQIRRARSEHARKNLGAVAREERQGKPRRRCPHILTWSHRAGQPCGSIIHVEGAEHCGLHTQRPPAPAEGVGSAG